MHAILSRNHTGGAKVNTNSRNLRITECPVASLSGLDSSQTATLPVHVAHVHGMCAQIEMIGTDTRSVITVVTDLHARGNWAEVHLPRESMGANRLPINLHLPITTWN